MQAQLQTEIQMERVQQDSAYREELAQVLLARCAAKADHVELRRTAIRVFPELARTGSDDVLASIVGHAATIRVRQIAYAERDVTDARLEMTATAPLDYPDSYGDLAEPLRATLIAFCERQLVAGRDGPEALSELLRLHGWPYSERTFYVGPWKAARLRMRRRTD